MRQDIHRFRSSAGSVVRLGNAGHTEWHRWLSLGGLGAGMAALALAPVVQAENLFDADGQQRWVAAFEIPFDGPDGVDTPRLHVALENQRALENGVHVASVGYQWVLGESRRDQRQTGFYSGNSFAYVDAGYGQQNDAALFYRSDKMVFNDQALDEYSRFSDGAKGVLVLGAIVGVVLAVSNGTSSDGPSEPDPEPQPQPNPGPTPGQAAAGVIGQALSPSSIAGFFNSVLGGGGTASP
ncbi:MAG TPA: hypothetical protein VNK45_06400 [Candidatus Acidoferrales bacterium]|nr:hypothetical protein [Candidatus Acidoferrales bacterium]